MIEPRPGNPPPSRPRASPIDRASEWLAGLSDLRLVALVASSLFVLAAWPLLLVDLPPLQDLPNHVATAHIIAHPELYPEHVFNGFAKSNSLLMLWLWLAGGHGLFLATRVFVALVLALGAVALPTFLVRLAGRERVGVALLFAWPLVHGFFVAMGMLNFAFAFALALLLLSLLDRQRERATFATGAVVAATALVLWYAHPFPLAVVLGLAALHAATRTTWPLRLRAGLVLLLPLAPAGLLAIGAAVHHLLKAEHVATVASATSDYLSPPDLALHLWLDASGALTWLGSATLLPAALLPYFAWKGYRLRSQSSPPPLFSTLAIALLAAAYVVLPFMLSNWWYLNCRLVPFLWIALAVRLPRRLPSAVAAVLVASALAFSAATGIDYLRLDRDRREFTAGIASVPARASLLPLMFRKSKTSHFTASLTHAWGYYTLAKDTSAPLVFAIERSYPIGYRELPPPALIAPALDRLAEELGTPGQMCQALHQPTGDSACTGAWQALWRGFWRQAAPRFTHLLTWAMPPEARPMLPAHYRLVFSEGDLAIYTRTSPTDTPTAPGLGPAGQRAPPFPDPAP